MSTGFFVLILALMLLALRVPLALALIAAASLGNFFLHAQQGWVEAFRLAGGDLFASLDGLLQNADLALVPLFILLGNLAFYAGIATRVYDAAAVWLRPLPGGLAMASIMGCGGFAAISGSSLACASTMGRICIPEMLRLGYDPKLATSSVAAGGTLGSLIPPSILFILYGLFTGSPVEHLFLAGVLPGLLSLAGMLAVVVWWVLEDPAAAPAAPRGRATPRDAAIAAWPAILLFAVIVGGLFSGALTATEVALISVALTLAIGVAQQRLGLDVIWRACRESLIQSAGLVLIIAAAKLFIGFVAASDMPESLSIWVETLHLSYLVLMLSIVAVYLILGMFLDPVAVLVITLPFLMPLIQFYDLNPIWFGVIIVKLLEIGLITPPVGLNVYVIGSVTRNVQASQVFLGVTRFLAVDALILAILILFPVISTLLPTGM